MGFVRIDHVGLVAYTIEQARQVLGEELGLELDERRSNWPDGSYFAPEQTYNYFFSVGEGETQVEVLIPEAGATSGRPASSRSGARACTTSATPAPTSTPRPSV